MCSRCEELEERVAWLEGELGLQSDLSDTSALYATIRGGMSASTSGARAPTRLVLALYRAKGRVVTKYQLLESLPPQAGGDDERSSNLPNVWVSQARKGLGYGSIATAWGAGFRLTPEGMEKVGTLLGERAAI